MTSIYLLSVVAIFFLGIFYVLKKVVSLNIPTLLAVVFIYLGGLIFALIAFLIGRPEFELTSALKKGVGLALIGGIVVAAFDVLNLLIFKKGGDVSLFTPLLNGGGILVASIAGVLFLKESITLIQFLGTAAIIGGIFLLMR